jgi:hypothetical protein
MLTDEYDDIKAIECIVCHERWYVDVKNVPGPRNRYVLVTEEVEANKVSNPKVKMDERRCPICENPFIARGTRQIYCNSIECQRARMNTNRANWRERHNGQDATR